jgi:hypothetical protein
MSAADKLLKRMKQSKAQWSHRHLKKLYLGFGFEMDEDGPHTMYIHPRFPRLCTTVTRSSYLAIGYVQEAIKLIEELQRLEKKEQNESRQR